RASKPAVPTTSRSSPQLLRSQPGALRHRLELCPDDSGMHFGSIAGLRRESTIRTGDDPIPTYETGEADQPLGDVLRMLDDVAGMRDDAGDQHLVVGQLQC